MGFRPVFFGSFLMFLLAGWGEGGKKGIDGG